MRSELSRNLIGALRGGDMATLHRLGATAAAASVAALQEGPNAWIPARLLDRLLRRFLISNIRSVLPNGGDEFWTPLVNSLLNSDNPVWEFFPSQIQAINRGLLERVETFSLQMPTGAGKTTLCETLLYWHTRRFEGSVAVLLVPYRSLALELRRTLVRRLNAMGIPARCAYGGTVPTANEVRNLSDVRVMVATPEALSGVLSSDSSFFHRISLAICDEGHLLDSGERGVGLELLLARMRARQGGGPRIVFISAVIPNIEEINAWLGGDTETVVQSDYRPVLAEFAVLRSSVVGAARSIALVMHPHLARQLRFTISPFLGRQDFQWLNPETGRSNTYAFSAIKTQSIAAARKALTMGAAAVFSANKRGKQGVESLAEELVKQVRHSLPLPQPSEFINTERVAEVVSYLEAEYGGEWIGTRALRAGAVLHHGDIPQETREMFELLLIRGDVRLAICTNTLAEGVNLPIRTLVLYSVRRLGKGGQLNDLLTRDIKNLVGRAGRAGATTKGLVICANDKQWPLVEPVARQVRGEPVIGALRTLMARIVAALAGPGLTLTNQTLEFDPQFHTLIDGIDATLIDLAAEEIGEAELVRLATELADQTFASRQTAEESSRTLLREIFALRASRVAGIRSAGRLEWVRDTGTNARMLDSVEADLLPRRATWDNFVDPLDPELVSVILEWAWTQRALQDAIRRAYQKDDGDGTEPLRQSFTDLVAAWLSGSAFVEMAFRAHLPVEEVLGVHACAGIFVLQTLVEQAVILLERLLNSQERRFSDAVIQFPDHLRFGVPTAAARVLAAHGVRHRRAAVMLGDSIHQQGPFTFDRTVLAAALQLLTDEPDQWRDRLGRLVFENTLRDLS